MIIIIIIIAMIMNNNNDNNKNTFVRVLPDKPGFERLHPRPIDAEV
jgi:hypothetical protein